MTMRGTVSRTFRLWHNVNMTHFDHFTVVVGDRGRVVLPSRLRQLLDLHSGDRLIFTVEPDGGMRVVSAREQARRLEGFYRERYPDRSPVDELIAERREETRRETEPM
jgi:AbrB family looped-hinge helix DNA binding protein